MAGRAAQLLAGGRCEPLVEVLAERILVVVVLSGPTGIGRTDVGGSATSRSGRVRAPERSVDRDDLTVADAPDHASLGGVAARDRDVDVEIHRLADLGEVEVLGGRPDDRPAGGLLERGSGRSEAGPRTGRSPNAQPGNDGQIPPMRIVGGLKAEPLAV